MKRKGYANEYPGANGNQYSKRRVGLLVGNNPWRAGFAVGVLPLGPHGRPPTRRRDGRRLIVVDRIGGTDAFQSGCGATNFNKYGMGQIAFDLYPLEVQSNAGRSLEAGVELRLQVQANQGKENIWYFCSMALPAEFTKAKRA